MSDTNTKENITEQGTRTPSSGRDGGGKAGPPRPSSYDRGAMSVNYQAGMSIQTTDVDIIEKIDNSKVEEEMIFGRRSSLARTPPKSWAGSTSSLASNTSTGSIPKRKRQEEEEGKNREDVNERTINEIKIFNKKLLNKIKELKNLIEGSSNTRSDIKKKALELGNMTSSILRTERQMLEMLENEKMLKTPEVKDDEVQPQKKAAVNTMNIEAKKPETRTIGTQTNVWAKENEDFNIDDVTNLERWKEIEYKDWDEHLYTNTEIAEGNPINTKDCVAKVVLIEPEDRLMTRGIQRQYKDRFPELGDTEEDFAIFEQTTKIRNEKVEEITRKIIIKIELENVNEDLWNKLTKLKKETKDVAWVAMHGISCMKAQKLRKMVECIFHNTNTMVKIYAKKIHVRETRKDQKQQNTYALILDDKTKEYSEILKGVKEKVINKDTAKIIKGIRCTREGKMVIITEKDDNAVRELEKVIKGSSDTIQIKKTGLRDNVETLHIKGMEVAVEAKEVLSAIESKIGSLQEKEFKLSKFRPNANKTMSVTFTINKEDAKILIDSKEIRIGLVMAKIEKRIQVKKCYKCWAYDHEASECKGPDRRRICYKCGKEGHPAKTCTEKERCPICDKEGHKAGTGACKIFRRALSRARMKLTNEKKMLTQTSENTMAQTDDIYLLQNVNPTNEP